MKKEHLLLLGVVAFLYFRSKGGGFQLAPCYPLNFIGPIPPGGFTCPGSGVGVPGGAGGGSITWISCDDPNADPVMCAQLAQTPRIL